MGGGWWTRCHQKHKRVSFCLQLLCSRGRPLSSCDSSFLKLSPGVAWSNQNISWHRKESSLLLINGRNGMSTFCEEVQGLPFSMFPEHSAAPGVEEELKQSWLNETDCESNGKGALVSCGCSSKFPQTGELEATERCFLTIPEARILKSRCPKAVGRLLLASSAPGGCRRSLQMPHSKLCPHRPGACLPVSPGQISLSL